MRAFGATDPVVAASEWKGMTAGARVTGLCASEILDAVRFEKHLACALSGCDTAIAFSRRPTALRQDEFTLPAHPGVAELEGAHRPRLWTGIQGAFARGGGAVPLSGADTVRERAEPEPGAGGRGGAVLFNGKLSRTP